MSKKRLHFYTLTIIFLSIATLTLIDAWGTSAPNENINSMMSQSMGNMMVSMHLKNITLTDMLTIKIQQNQTSEKHTHHDENQGESQNINNIPRVLTAAIIVLLPFIVAGALFLAIVWIN